MADIFSFTLPEPGKSLFRGDKVTLEALITESGVNKVLDDYIITFTAKKNIDDADDAVGTIQHSTEDGGIEIIQTGLIHITILPIDTIALTQETEFTCDIQLQKDSDDEDVKTVGKGKITFSKDVTRDYNHV